MRPHSRSTGFDVVPALAIASGIAMLAAIWLIFFHAPVERTMGIVQKIFYIHLPSAIGAYAGFFVCCIASIWYLLKGDVRADIVARAGAETGVLLGLGVLTTGPLWARKAWGTFWTGEPRLLLTLVLFLIFVAYLLVRNFGGRSELTRRICAVLAILGVADIPLIRYSVERWRGNHPQVVTGEGGGISPEMQVALLAGFIAVGLVFATLLLVRFRVGLAEEDIERYHREIAARRDRADDLADARLRGTTP